MQSVPMAHDGKGMSIGEALASRLWAEPFPDAFTAAARLLLEEGVDLLAATVQELARGTPVYVNALADVVAVQRRMAQHHIRTVPVLAGGRLIGCVDLLDLALLTQPLAPPA